MGEEEKVADRILGAYGAMLSSELQRFGGWIAAGSGGAIALLLGNLTDLSASMEVRAIFTACWLFVASLLVYVLEKWIAAQVSGASAALPIVMEAHEGVDLDRLDGPKVIATMIGRSIWPFSWFMRRAAKKRHEPGARIARLSQVQTWGLVLQLLLALGAIGILLLASHARAESGYSEAGLSRAPAYPSRPR